MIEGCYVDGKYVPWTAAHILDAADAEVGPGCCDESYQRLRKIMEAAPELLRELEIIVDMAKASIRLILADVGREYEEPAAITNALSVISKARGQS